MSSLADAFAKLNLSLLVGTRRADGLHPVRSVAQSIDWPDRLGLEDSGEDRLDVDHPDLGDTSRNLAWQALEAVRTEAGSKRAMALSLAKRIPLAAGLGGGSADAAAALTLVARRLGVSHEALAGLAPALGADVPFCLSGGTALMEGAGERLTPLPPLDIHCAVVVPPFRLDTASVYGRWDALEGPAAEAVPDRDLPPALRRLDEPIRNDLTPAAFAVEPRLGDWVADTARTWGAPVLMSGSGPALFALFPTAAEAEDAVAAISGARSGRACRAVQAGVHVFDEGVEPEEAP